MSKPTLISPAYTAMKNAAPNAAGSSDSLRQQAIDWAVAHGLLVRVKGSDDTYQLSHAPVALLPAPFPRLPFEFAYYLQPMFNMLVHRVVLHSTFLDEVCQSIVDVDEFNRELYQIYKAVRAEGVSQSISLGIHRSDYMLHSTGNQQFTIQQVELNTIASSFSSLSFLAGDMQRFLLQAMGIPNADHFLQNMPENKAFHGFADGLAEALKLYNSAGSIIAMVVQPNEQNSFDQRWIEYHLHDRHNIRLIRRTLQDFHERGSIDSKTKKLQIDGFEIGVVYFRAGYSPNDYPTPKHFEARKLIEQSNAIKCPTVAYQLAGMKKVQQVLAAPGVIEQFFPEDPSIPATVRKCFAGLYPLGEGDDEVVARAIASPHLYVLKPQREGGGNNYFDDELVKQLQTMSVTERSAYILMDRIFPPVGKTMFMRLSNITEIDCVSELGIYGVYIGDHTGKTIVNKTVGHLVRTKGEAVNEGGVAAGYAHLDSPLLID